MVTTAEVTEDTVVRRKTISRLRHGVITNAMPVVVVSVMGADVRVVEQIAVLT